MKNTPQITSDELLRIVPLPRLSTTPTLVDGQPEEGLLEVIVVESVDEGVDGRVHPPQPDKTRRQGRMEHTTLAERFDQVHSEEWQPAYDKSTNHNTQRFCNSSFPLERRSLVTVLLADGQSRRPLLLWIAVLAVVRLVSLVLGPVPGQLVGLLRVGLVVVPPVFLLLLVVVLLLVVESGGDVGVVCVLTAQKEVVRSHD